VFSVLRAIVNTRRPGIATRSRVNLIGGLDGPERTDGVVEAIDGDRARVEWPNGAKSVEQLRSLVRIVA
jgi:hypothetical protein